MSWKMRDTTAIADSGPLICLARINQLELLPRLFSKIIVPPGVWNEVTVKGQGHLDAHKVSQVTWITVQTPDPLSVKPLSILVDAGEAEAIALAQTTADCTILIDDARARKIAQRLNIKQIGTIGLLLRAKRQGLLKKIKPHIDALVENGIYIRRELIDAVLKDAGE
jgi:predicted nucleic acid-binding protein